MPCPPMSLTGRPDGPPDRAASPLFDSWPPALARHHRHPLPRCATAPPRARAPRLVVPACSPGRCPALVNQATRPAAGVRSPMRIGNASTQPLFPYEPFATGDGGDRPSRPATMPRSAAFRGSSRPGTGRLPRVAVNQQRSATAPAVGAADRAGSRPARRPSGFRRRTRRRLSPCGPTHRRCGIALARGYRPWIPVVNRRDGAAGVATIRHPGTFLPDPAELTPAAALAGRARLRDPRLASAPPTPPTARAD